MARSQGGDYRGEGPGAAEEADRGGGLLNRRGPRCRPGGRSRRWRCAGRCSRSWVYVAFVTDVYSRRIIVWQTTYRPVRADLALDALKMAIWQRRREGEACPVFCVSVLQVGIDSVGIGGGGAGPGPCIWSVVICPSTSLALALRLDGGSPFSLSRSRARLSTGVADRQLSPAQVTASSKGEVAAVHR